MRGRESERERVKHRRGRTTGIQYGETQRTLPHHRTPTLQHGSQAFLLDQGFLVGEVDEADGTAGLVCHFTHTNALALAAQKKRKKERGALSQHFNFNPIPLLIPLIHQLI